MAKPMRGANKRPFLLEENVKEIPLTKGQVALVDDEDFEWLSQHVWIVKRSDRGYLYARTSTTKGGIYMHRLLLNAPEGMQVDHINHNGLDNRRQNMRLCTNSQNSYNSLAHRKPKTSHFKGVCWHKSTQKWLAQIGIDWKRLHLGIFDSEEDAAKAYDAKAIELFGEFALLNFPEVKR